MPSLPTAQPLVGESINTELRLVRTGDVTGDQEVPLKRAMVPTPPTAHPSVVAGKASELIDLVMPVVAVYARHMLPS